ncbi:MAG: phosphate/phosphite/phosphonate ABC transporter substrate-binding protein [Sphaerochaetaceae bacterium]|nr:phosphate/phosphite/phosphonate ABC transporter substrate-binding protein [Sphaerochaetaceae bacterium]
MKKIVLLLFALLIGIGLVGCSGSEYITPDVLEVQFIPSGDADVLDAQRLPLQNLLEAELGMDVNVTVATDYNALIEGMKSEKIHVGFLASASYVLAHDEGAAEVILKSLRYDVDDDGNLLEDAPMVAGYRSQLIAAAESGIEEVADLEGKTIAIASFTSTSGFIWPANLLADNGLDPETDVTWLDAGSHDGAVLAVINGQADAAFTYKDARQRVVEDYPNVNELVVFVQNTELIPNDTISVLPNLHPAIKYAVEKAFLAIAASEDGLEVIDALYSHLGYAPAQDSDYDIVRTYLARQEEWSFGE